jgi:hypothetical protein
VRNYKTKEKSVVDFIAETFPAYTWINDKTIIDGCSKRRPDLLLDLGTKVIIVEVDEFKHSTYTAECEIARLNQLSLDLGCRPMILIRFNPDKYVTATGIKIPSCWSIHQHTKVLRVPRTQTENWNNRLQVLSTSIKWYLSDEPTEPVTIKELFY